MTVVVSHPNGPAAVAPVAQAKGVDYVDVTSVGTTVAEVIAANVTDGHEGVLVLGGSGATEFDADVAAALGAGLVVVAPDSAAAHVKKAAAQRGAAAVVVDTFDADALAAGESVAASAEPVMGPDAFAHWLQSRAKRKLTHIVLPEGDDDRILQAAAEVLASGFCTLTILGDPEAMRARATELGVDISGATLEDPSRSEYAEEFAREFYELRKHKGMTEEKAAETMTDISYFATMMIHKGLADGMVSGAAHTTAHTIKPSFQIIKTLPGISTVSSIFLMVMPGRLWAFGDCAVNPNPTAEQLAEIAQVSAATAAKFGIDPKVAMLSYSTGTSGSGPDVDRAVAATEAAKAHEGLVVDGPLQFDAAVDPGVAAKKAPESPVAGQANVLIFPDLEAGNIGYKAVQRTAGALAVGPILQGLKKPVNDLSRGATVPDIVNTVAITAIQAQGE